MYDVQDFLIFYLLQDKIKVLMVKILYSPNMKNYSFGILCQVILIQCVRSLLPQQQSQLVILEF